MPIEYVFALSSSEQCIKIISSPKKCGLFSSVFKKIIPNYTTPTFQEVGGVAYPLTFCRWQKNFSLYRDNHHTIDKSLLSSYFLFFCLPPFSIEMKQKFNS